MKKAVITIAVAAVMTAGGMLTAQAAPSATSTQPQIKSAAVADSAHSYGIGDTLCEWFKLPKCKK